ncbi:hypothetical protein NYE71_32785 [Bacillus sp. FSL K6-0273]|uniref:hypothetical protein n=1 Tax=Bacillus TaxID=1386 RepID=UPI0018CF9DD6|nr:MULTISPECIES: hypothetical protein [Bacillus cereus group]MEB9535877.1 hypothetical protein [Bacillus cereus]MBG9702276.1 hypothetical protein [Bacillus thuringiensis]MCU5415233.1 hypothetical protein [Bacillus wiedmannii]MDG1651677.1 hypothetical protein [Bacillus pacificus]MEB9726204.1 hypothetical protein [Bacillus cereus]
MTEKKLFEHIYNYVSDYEEAKSRSIEKTVKIIKLLNEGVSIHAIIEHVGLVTFEDVLYVKEHWEQALIENLIEFLNEKNFVKAEEAFDSLKKINEVYADECE